jgi:Kef-type K+ transport system membrane component KefB/nucleotide-binding universal stress UspA family protein
MPATWGSSVIERTRHIGVSSIRYLPATIILMVMSIGGAFAADARPSESAEAIFIVQVILLLAFGRLIGEVMQRMGQSAITGQLIAGILLGPTVFGAIWPDLQHTVFPKGDGQATAIEAVSQFGILMLLLLTGMETDLSVVKPVKRAALMASLTGITIPFACGFVLGQLLPEQMLPDPGRRLITSLFLGTALSISSVKIVATVVRDMGFMRRVVGQVIVASAVIDDAIGWIIMAVTLGIARHGSFDLATAGESVSGTALFLVASFTLGPRAVFLLIRWANDNFVVELPVITAILVLMGTMALITYAIGVNTVLGAFVAGMLAGQSPILTKHIQEQLRGLIVALFMPIFFGVAGLHTDLRALATLPMLLLAVGMILIASIGKFSGALTGGRLGGLTFRESLALACGMNARGSTEVIIATLGVTAGVLNQQLFTTIVVMAVVTTMAMPPMLRWALSRVPPRPDEEQRLEREASEARGFVSNLERLLVAVDDGPSGRLASRLVGLLAGSRRIVTTVLPVGEATPRVASGRFARSGTPDDAEAVVKDFGEQAEAAEGQPENAAAVDVETVRPKAPVEETVPEQARKGYDLLVVGVEPAREEGRFSERVARVALGFDGPFAIVAARGHHREDTDRAERDILVPVTGTDFSRHGAEMALALARASNATVTMLYVRSDAAARSGWHQEDRGGMGNEDAILREIEALGEQQGVVINAIMRRGSAETEIPRQLMSGQHDLVVMGVSRRTGDTLFFGDVADAVLDSGGPSIVLVSSQA